jgi:hypothetical protein
MEGKVEANRSCDQGNLPQTTTLKHPDDVKRSSMEERSNSTVEISNSAVERSVW